MCWISSGGKKKGSPAKKQTKEILKPLCLQTIKGVCPWVPSEPLWPLVSHLHNGIGDPCRRAGVMKLPGQVTRPLEVGW